MGLQRIIANASVKINDLTLKYVDDNCLSEVTLKIEQFETVSTTLNWQPRPLQSGYDIFLTPWKLCHRSSSFKNVSLFLDVVKPQVREEAIFCNVSIDIRLKAYLHWLWNQGQAPKIDPNSSNSSSTTQKSKKQKIESLEYMTSASMASGRSIRSISARSDGNMSVHSIHSNLSNATDKSETESGGDSLGPVLSCDILIRQHIDLQISCFQLSMCS